MNKNKHLFLKYLLLVLIAVMLFLGYEFFQQQIITTTAAIPISSPAQELSSKDFAIAFQQPTASSTQSDRLAHVDLVVKDAVSTSTLYINSCLSNPPIVSIKRGLGLTLVNNDSVSHTIIFSPSATFVVATSSSKIIKADFGKTVGIYPFRCDKATTTIGIVIIN
jgi:hypothetical protein